MSPKELRSPEHGHNLEWLWERFKEKETDPTLDRFDTTVHALHEFEELRYPDKIPHRAVMMAITWLPRDAVTSSGTTKAKQYEVFISEIDRLVVAILKRGAFNLPPLIRTIRRNGRGALRYLNPHARRWLGTST